MTLKEQEQELFKKYQGGDEAAKKELLRSLAPVINSQVGKFSGSGLPQVALTLEAQRLTLGALKTYDPKQLRAETKNVAN